MNKKRKLLMASYLLCATMAIGGAVVACSQTKPQAISPTLSTSLTGTSTTKKDYAYAPDIFVEWGEYSEKNIPQAVKGSAYKIFGATAEDLYGDKLDVTTRVYLHYLEDTKALISLKDDQVTPTTYGIYTVEYTATDIFGNVGVYTYDFECEEVDTLSVSLSGQTTSAVAGVETPIASYAFENEIGSVTTKITATHQDGKAVYELTEEDAFLPMYAGVYTIEYACSDYNLTVKESYEVTVEKNTKPVFFGEASIPQYFIVGKEYTLPSVEAYQFNTGSPVLFTPVVYVQYGNGMWKQLSGNNFSPEREASLNFKYVIASGSEKQEQIYTSRAIDVGETGTTFDLAKYFYSNDAKVVANENSLNVSTATNGARVEFANQLTSRRFSLTLSTALETTRFNSVDIYLTDSEDESVQLKITYGNPLTSGGYLCINDGERNETKLYESKSQKITYEEEDNEVSLNGKLFLNCPENFKGFPSGKINLALQFNGVQGPSEIELLSLNNQTLCYWPGDFFAPEIWFDLPDKEVYPLGEKVDLGAIECADVLDPKTKLQISLLSPSGEYVTSTSGVFVKDYEGAVKNCSFMTAEYGEYIVNLKVMDGNGNSKSYKYLVEVRDLIAPQASFESKMAKTVKVDEAFTLSNVIVTDDLSASDKCTVTVTLIGGPYGDVKILTPGKTYKFQTKGVYYLYYRVEDEMLNTTTLCHKLIVE